MQMFWGFKIIGCVHFFNGLIPIESGPLLQKCRSYGTFHKGGKGNASKCLVQDDSSHLVNGLVKI